jgi:sugar transferase (PEP-CTERM/EpsH1 system associated)
VKLLFLAHRIPYPPNKGDKIRSYHQLRAFAERGHEVHLIAFADEVEDLQYQVDLARSCTSVRIVRLRKFWAKLRALIMLLTSRPLSLGYFGSLKLKRLVKRTLAEQNFDAIFVYSSAMAQYVPREWQSRTVVDWVDVDSEKWREYAERTSPPQAWLYRLEAKRLRRYEYEIVSRFANTVLTTNREAALLDQLDEFTRRARLRVITNGVGLAPTPQAQANVLVPRLVFTGAMDYYANIEAVEWFAREVFPLIRQQEPHTEFFIVGSNPTTQVKRLANLPGVTVTGFVEDVRPYLNSATACVVPLRIARGVQNKLLEAMAAGKAVIATPEASAGLRIMPGEDLLTASTSREFADAALQVIRDKGLRENLGWRARRFVETEHDWKPLLKKLVDLMESVAQRPSDSESRKARAASRS